MLKSLHALGIHLKPDTILWQSIDNALVYQFSTLTEKGFLWELLENVSMHIDVREYNMSADLQDLIFSCTRSQNITDDNIHLSPIQSHELLLNASKMNIQWREIPLNNRNGVLKSMLGLIDVLSTEKKDRINAFDSLFKTFCLSLIHISEPTRPY